jgi:signal transduction histidine kinase
MLVWDSISALNLTLCVIILILGYRNYLILKNKTSLYVGIGFALFGISHFVTLLGLREAAEGPLIVVRTLGYLLVLIAMYTAILLERLLKIKTLDLQKAERLATIGEISVMVSHDLRNPLTRIYGAVYILKERLSSKRDQKAKEALDDIDKAVESSVRIIADLSDYSREMQLEPVGTTPKSIVREALSHVQVPERVRVVDSTEDSPRMSIDFQKMERVFVNLIDNAIEAMPEEGTLTISSKQAKDGVEIAFSDTGTGMTKEIVEKLWTPLFTTKPKGMGFGLVISKRIVEAHGGSMRVESTPRRGSTFTVTIPTKPTKPEGFESAQEVTRKR